MSSLSPEDIDTLSLIGHDVIQTTVALVVEAILYTLYFVLVVIAGRLLLRKRSKISTTMFLIILTMFILDTAMCILDVHDAIEEMTLTLTSTAPLSLPDRYKLLNTIPWSVTNSLFAYMVCFGDVIVVWRAYTFWSHGRDRYMMILPALPLLGTFIGAGIVSFCVAREVSEDAPGSLVNPPFCHNVQQTMYSMTVVTTAIATAMIFYKTWLYRRDIGRAMHGANAKTRTEKVMLILIESGLLYFLISLEFVISDIKTVTDAMTATPNLVFSNLIWTYMTSHIVGIYPALMVVLVHSQRSYLDQTIISTHIETMHLGPTHLNSTSAYTSSTVGSKKPISTFRSGDTTAHTIEIEVHETHETDNEPGRIPTLPGSLVDVFEDGKTESKPHSFV